MALARPILGNLIAGLVSLLLATAGCGHPGAGRGGTGAVPSPAVPVAATVVPTTQVSAPTAPAATRVLTGSNPQITPDLDGQIVQLPAGRSFLVNLGGGVDWIVHWTPADAVRAVLTTVRPNGSQGYFSIDDPGRTVLMTASGASICPTPSAATPQSCVPGVTRTVQVTVLTRPPEP